VYLPKNKFRIKSTFGDEIESSNGVDYIGKYIELADGRIFEGDSLSNVKGRLSRKEKVNLKAIERPFNDYLGPTVLDYKVGLFTRYFIRDNRDGKITEVGLRQFKEKRRLNYVKSGKIEWIIQGPAENKLINDIPFIGAEERNKKTVLEFNKELRGIKSFIKNYKEFVR